MKYLPLLVLITLLSNCTTEETRMMSFIPPDADLVWMNNAPSPLESPLSWFMRLERSVTPTFEVWWQELSLTTDSELAMVRISYQNPVWFSVQKVDTPPNLPSDQESSIYQNVEVHQTGGSQGLYYALLDGYLIVSDQAVGVEKAIYQKQWGSGWLSIPNELEVASPWMWSAKIPGTANATPAFWQLSGTDSEENWTFKGWPSEGLLMLPELSALDMFKYALFACDSILPLSPSTYWGAGWEMRSEFGAFLIFPGENFSTEGFDVLKESEYLQFTFQQLLMPATSQLGDDPWLLKLEDHWILHRDQSGLRLLVDAMLQNGMLSSDPGLVHLAERIGEGATFVTFEQQQDFQRLIGQKDDRLVGALQRNARRIAIEVTHRYLCERGDVQALFHLQTSAKDRFLIQEETGPLSFTNERLEVIWQVHERDSILGAWIIPGLSSRAPDQILYQTKTSIHLLGLDGGSVIEEAWSVPGGSAHQGTVIRFAERSLSNIFLPSNDGRIYAFDLYGTPLEGWVDGVESEQLLFPLQHFAWDGGDFIFSIDTTGALWVFNRFGDLRFQPVSGESGTPPSFFLNESVQRIVWAENNGMIRVVNLQGETFRLDVGAVPPVRQFSFWENDDELIYGLLDAKHLIEAGYNGRDFSVRRRSPTPAGATRLIHSFPEAGIIGYWQERERRFFVVPLEEAVPLSFPPYVLSNAQGYLLVGAYQNEVRVYQVER